MSSINSLGGSPAWAAAGTRRTDRPPGGPDPSQAKQAVFKKLDADSSGGIGSGELGALLTPLAQRTGGTQASDNTAAFGKMDSDGDGSLAADELDSGLKALLGSPSDTVSFARTRGASGPPPGPPPGGPPPGPPPDAASQAASASSNTASADPLDTDGDGTVSASERAAGEIKQALQDLLKAVDSDGDAAISDSDSEAARFVELLKQVQSVGASGGSDRAAGGRQLADADASTVASDLADQVMRLYAQGGASTDPSARAGRLNVAA